LLVVEYDKWLRPQKDAAYSAIAHFDI